MLDRYGGCLNISGNVPNPRLITIWLMSWTPFTYVSFCKWKRPIKTSRFIRQCKMNIQNRHSRKRCHVKTSIWCCISTYIFFWLNPRRNADPHIITLLGLSSIRDCDDEPEGTLFYLYLSYFYSIKIMSRITAGYLQWTIHIKTKDRVYMCIKKQIRIKISRPYNPSLGKWKSISFMFEYYKLYFTHQLYPTKYRIFQY